MRNLLIGLILGGILGSGTTYYICKKKMDEREDEIRSEARKEYKEYYERKQVEEDEAIATHVKKVPDKPIPQEYKELVNNYRVEEPDPAELENPQDDEEEVDYAEEETVVDDLIQEHLEKQNPNPKIILPESFGELNTYDTETLTFYQQDRVLVHEDETLVDDINFLIGDSLDRYGWADDDDDVLYVRNYKLQRDYEIIKKYEEYPVD